MGYRRFNITYYSMLIALFPLVVFILSAINKKVVSLSPFLDEILSSLNDYPLSEFEYSQNDNNPDKYNGVLYTFPGSKIGCTCVNVTRYYYDQSGQKEVNPGSCSINKTRNGCENIAPKEPKKLYKWENGIFYSKKYDTSELSLKGYLHFLNSSVSENEECQNGYKKCGKLDDMGNYLCVPESEECPINDIKVKNGRSAELEAQNYYYSNISGDKYFYYTNNSNNPVISKLKVTEGKLCMDRTYIHTDYPQYILDNNFQNYGCKHKIDGKLYESNFEVLDTSKKADLYKNSDLNINRIYEKWYYDFPLHSLEAEMTLYPQRYIGFKKNCLKKNGAFSSGKFPFSEENLKEKDRIMENTLFYNKYTLWFSIISFILEILSCATFNIDSESNRFLIWIWAFVNLLFYMSMSIPLYLNIKNISKFEDLPTCGGKITNLKIDFYNSAEKKLKTTIILSIIFANLQILFIIGIVFIKKYVQFIDGPNFSTNINYNAPPEKPYYNNMGPQSKSNSTEDNLKSQGQDAGYSNY